MTPLAFLLALRRRGYTAALRLLRARAEQRRAAAIRERGTAVLYGLDAADDVGAAWREVTA